MQTFFANQSLFFMQVFQNNKVDRIESTYRHKHLCISVMKFFQQFFCLLKFLTMHEVLKNDIGINKHFHIRCRIYRLVPLQEVHLHYCWNLT
jgi:hypothetical protein